jgi:hypothetical protein
LQPRRIEAVISHIDLIADISLDWLARLVLNGHPREEILYTTFNTRFRILVDCIG